MEIPPIWVIGLCGLSALATLYMVPQDIARPIREVLIDGDAAKLVKGLAAAVGFGVLLVTALQIKVDLDDRAVERDVRRDEAIDRAWTRILTRASGNTGKGGALSLLYREGAKLDGVDLSCRALGDWDFATARCIRPVLFGKIEWLGTDIRPDPIEDIDLRDARVDTLILTNMRLHIADGRGAAINSLHMTGGYLSNDGGTLAVWEGVIAGGNIAHAKLKASHLDVSGSVLGPPENFAVDRSFVGEGYYFWGDNPPTRWPNDRLLSASDTSSAFYGLDEFPHLHACRPPEDHNGEVVPLSTRGPIKYFRCRKMKRLEALYRYPTAYAQKHPKDALPRSEPPLRP